MDFAKQSVGQKTNGEKKRYKRRREEAKHRGEVIARTTRALFQRLPRVKVRRRDVGRTRSSYYAVVCGQLRED